MSTKQALDKFDGTGFHTWQVKLKGGYLMKKNLWNVVKPMAQGENPQTRAAQAQFTQKDEQALGIIITGLDDTHVHYIDDANTAHEAWQTLEKMFGAKAKHSKISLKMQMYGLQMGEGEDLASLINRLKSLNTQLVYVGAPIDEEDRVAILLKALPQEYNQIVTVLKEKDPIPSLNDVINSLQEEEKKIKGTSTSTNGTAFLISSKQRCKHCKRTNHDSKDCYSMKTCTICKKPGHPASRCFQNNVNYAGNNRYNNEGHNRLTYNNEGHNRLSYNNEGYNRQSYNNQGNKGKDKGKAYIVEESDNEDDQDIL